MAVLWLDMFDKASALWKSRDGGYSGKIPGQRKK